MAMPPPLPCARGIPRWFWICSAGVVLAGFLGGVGLLAWHLRWRDGNARAIATVKAALRAEQEPLTLDELAARYPPLPAERNAAEALLDLWEAEAPEFWRAFRQGAVELGDRPQPAWPAALPILDQRSQPLRYARMTPAETASAEEFVAAQKSRRIALEAALARPACRFPVAITNGYAALLPHLSQLREETGRLRVAAALATDRGDTAAALDACETLTRLGEHLSAEPLLISQLVRLGILDGVLDDLSRLLSLNHPTSAGLDRMESLLRRMERPGALREALRSEPPTAMRAFDSLADMLASASSGGNQGKGTPAALRIGEATWRVAGWKNADRRLYLEIYWEAWCLTTNQAPGSVRAIAASLARAKDRGKAFPPKVVSSMLLPALASIPARFQNVEARRRAARVAVAIERHSLARNGELPERPAELCPDFLPAIPADPYGTAPLRYRKRAPGYVVYSVGSDGLDDGGAERTPGRAGSVKDTFDVTFIVER